MCGWRGGGGVCLGSMRRRARADPEWENYMRWPPGDSWSRRPGTNTVMFDGDWKNVDMSEPVCRISEGTVHWLKPGTPERFRIEKVEESENNRIRIGGVEYMYDLGLVRTIPDLCNMFQNMWGYTSPQTYEEYWEVRLDNSRREWTITLGCGYIT